MKKLKLFTLFAAILFATSMWATIPMGSVDGVTGHNGSFHVWGWALDPDQPSTAIAIHVYIYPQGSTNPVKGYNATVANLNRPDLKSSDPNSIGALYGTLHGFDCWIDVTSEVPAGTYDVRVWPINVGSNEGNHTITYSNNGGDVKTISISNPYTVSYHANGGTGAPSAQRKVTSINITLSSTTPTRAGYTFNGWNTNNSGTGTNYAKGATYSANASVTLYAKWTANKYTVTLNQQGGSGGSSSVQATYNANMPSMTKPSRTGYTFQGYYDATSGGTQYYKADGSSARTWNKTSNATLHARWTANTYTITLDPQGGSGGDASKTATFGQATPTVNIPGRNGYSFGGYYTGKNGSGTQYLKPDANNTATSVRNWDIASNTTLYAKWNARSYTITFDSNGGSSVASITQDYGTTITAPADPTREGYTFAGWEPALPETMPAQNMTVVAQWNEIPQPSGDILAGFTATDGCGGFGGEDHSKLVDGLFASGNEGVNWTKWCADDSHKSNPQGEQESSWWVDFYAENPIAVTGYILTTGNDNEQWGQGRNPNSWKIKAKLNAGDSWTTIATVTNDNTMQVANFTDFAFTLDQAGTYKYFRFMVYETEYDNCMQLCELRFIGNGGSTPEPAYYALLQELYNALGDDVWTGYGVNTGVISYSRGGAEAFHASFMGGNYAFNLPFAAFTEASKAANTDGSYTYTLTCNLPAQTGMGQETLHVTLKNGEITKLESENAGVEMQKEEGPVTGWAALQTALEKGGVIKLGDNVTAESSEAALIIPAGKTVVLELGGFTINRALAEAVENGSVIINHGTLAILGEGKIIGGKTTGNGGGILNNGVLTLYGGEISGNVAALGGGVYNNGGEQGFWMTGGLIKGNTATTHPAIGGEVIFNAQAVVQINADGDKVSIAEAIDGLATYDYIKPVMPDYDNLHIEFAIALKSDTENADQVVLSAESAIEGAVISVTPKEGYEIKDFKATYNTTEELSTTFDPETGAYSFTMPAANVTIEATIVKKAPTAIDEIDSQKSKVESRKMIVNDQLLIIRDGKTYNAQGAVVK